MFKNLTRSQILLWFFAFAALIIVFIGWLLFRNPDIASQRADKKQVETGLAEIARYANPGVENPEISTYSLICILESISFLKENAYIRIGDFAITVTGQCTYLDVDNERQTITVALVVRNTINKSEWIPPGRITTSITSPELIPERFAIATRASGGEIMAGSKVSIIFNRSNPINLVNFKASGHHGALINDLYTEDAIAAFVNTKKAAALGNNGLLVPLTVMTTE